MYLFPSIVTIFAESPAVWADDFLAGLSSIEKCKSLFLIKKSFTRIFSLPPPKSMSKVMVLWFVLLSFPSFPKKISQFIVHVVVFFSIKVFYASRLKICNRKKFYAFSVD